MKIIEPSCEILTEIDGEEILKRIERYGRTAYKSEAIAHEDSSHGFVKMLINRGHESVIEHESITVKFICDRGISHEIVRHRIASYTQESTRFCNYQNNRFGNEITLIKPQFDGENKRSAYNNWWFACRSSERYYFRLLRDGIKAEMARSVLPNSLKTEVVMTANLREWRHFIRLRSHKSAHPQIRKLSKELLMQFKSKIPVVFNDIEI